MRRTDLLDTTPEAHRKILEILRKMPPGWGAKKAFEMTDFSRRVFFEQTRAALVKEWEENHPGQPHPPSFKDA